MTADSVWGWAALGFALMTPATLWAGQIDPRRLAGANVWAKPFKFALSLAIHYATFAAIVLFLPEDERQRYWLVALAVVSSFGGGCELAYIALQAARGRHSHFNDSTPIEAVSSLLMGVGAVLVVSPAIAVGLLLILSPPDSWSAAVIVGTASGLLGGTVLTIWTASRMGALKSHFARANPGSAKTMPFTGWSLDGADLRPSHFLATHMMQVLPIASVIAAETLPTSAAVAASALASIAWTAMTLALFRWTINGLPLSTLLTTTLTN
jgi:hypothetical protein